MTLAARRAPTWLAAALASASCAGAADRGPQTTAPHDAEAPAPSAALAADDRARMAEALVRELHGRDRAAAHARFPARLREGIPLDKLTRTLDELARDLGALESAKVAAIVAAREPGWRIVHVVAFFARGAAVYKATYDDHDELRGLRVDVLAEAEAPGPGPADAYMCKQAYSLPARGRWVVVHGGRDPMRNKHVGHRHQWYAFDLVQKGEDGKSHRGHGKKNEDYLAFEQPVLAPADGVVLAVVDGASDNPPGQRDKYFIPGNMVAIDHGAGEHSYIAHFRQGSIVVKQGDRVKRGQLLGKVGNSGNTSEPHIHWHITDAPSIVHGHGLPICLEPMLVNGTHVPAPDPGRDDVLETP